jgi:hypothetical protein
MPLSETRIVLFEKVGFKKNFHVLFDEIETHIGNSKRGNNKCVFVPIIWVRHKLVRKILKENRYRISCEGNSLQALISWD